MRQVNDLVLSGSDAASVNGSQLDTNQSVNVTFHCVLSDSTAAGTFSIQGSNDVCQTGQSAQNFVVTNWVTIPNASVTMTAGMKQAMIILAETPCRWMRAVWTSSTPGTGTVTVNRFEQSI